MHDHIRKLLREAMSCEPRNGKKFTSRRRFLESLFAVGTVGVFASSANAGTCTPGDIPNCASANECKTSNICQQSNVCDDNTCLMSNICVDGNTCNVNSCQTDQCSQGNKENCGPSSLNSCQTNKCLTKNTCDTDVCKQLNLCGNADTCVVTNTCSTANYCTRNDSITCLGVDKTCAYPLDATITVPGGMSAAPAENGTSASGLYSNAGSLSVAPSPQPPTWEELEEQFRVAGDQFG